MLKYHDAQGLEMNQDTINCTIVCDPENRPQADITNDCAVDLMDFSVMANQWNLSDIDLAADLNEDHQVNIMDLALLAEMWFEGVSLSPVSQLNGKTE